MSLVEGVAGENQEGEDDMNINRITADKVLAAFETTGLIPMQDEYAGTLGNKRCACGLSAVYIAKRGYDSFETLGSIRADDILSEELDLNGFYFNGFIYGFDGHSCSAEMGELFVAGWEDGKASWEAVKHLSAPLSNVDEDNEDNEN